MEDAHSRCQANKRRHPRAHSAVSGRGQMEGRRSTHVGIRPDPGENWHMCRCGHSLARAMRGTTGTVLPGH